MQSNVNISDWACSLSGCDGGEPDSKIWLCGIEWGLDASKYDVEKYYKEELPKEIASGPVKAGNKYDWEGSLGYTYGRSFAKLYAAIHGRPIKDYRRVDKNKDILKLNLYPIAFNSTDSALWNTYGLEGTTGFKNKELFKIWCHVHRSRYFSKLVDRHNPRCIICTGSSYVTDFFVFFSSEVAIKTTINEIDLGDKRRYYFAELNNGTKLFVIPFFSGQRGLNSDELIQIVGNSIGSEIRS